MPVINFEFRHEINTMLGGIGHNYCYQCGACVGDCPAAQYSDRFNPRLIVLQALLGLEQALLGEDSVLWQCTNCFTCCERCPQEVKPVDVIFALKNLAVERGTYPASVRELSDGVLSGGRTVKLTGLSHKRRSELGLQPADDAAIDELKEILSSDEPTT